MERIDFMSLDNTCVFLLVPTCDIGTQCELLTADGEVIPAVNSWSIWRDKKIFRIIFPDKEKVRFENKITYLI